MLSNGARVCLVVLSGIPACGKTTVGAELRTSLENHGISAVLIEYDKILTNIGDDAAVTAATSDETVVSSSWRCARKEVSACVRELVRDQFESGCNRGEGAPGRARQETASVVQRRFWDSVRAHVPDSCERLTIILDDNMYYRSMRYEYYVIARSYGTGFAEVHIDVPLAVAMARNAKRKEGVPEDIIVNMASRIELPDAKRNWEWNSCVLRNDGSCSLREIASAACCVIDHGFSHPVTVRSAAELELVNHSADESAVHRVDIFLRKLVSDHVGTTKRMGARAENLRQAAKCANDARQYLLLCFKEGSLYLPDHVVTTCETEDPSASAGGAQGPLPTLDGCLLQSWQNIISSIFANLVTCGK